MGLRITSFGNRLFWDWQWNAERYPDLPARIAELRARGIRFLGYVNPYLAVGGPLYAEAAEKGHPAAIFALTYFATTRDANLKRLRAIADAGNPEGCHWLCEAHFADKTLKDAIEDCGVGARAGLAGSRAILAWAYAKGDGVAADPKEAIFWAKLARDLPELRKDQRDLIAGIGE